MQMGSRFRLYNFKGVEPHEGVFFNRKISRGSKTTKLNHGSFHFGITLALFVALDVTALQRRVPNGPEVDRI